MQCQRRVKFQLTLPLLLTIREDQSLDKYFYNAVICFRVTRVTKNFLRQMKTVSEHNTLCYKYAHPKSIFLWHYPIIVPMLYNKILEALTCSPKYDRIFAINITEMNLHYSQNRTEILRENRRIIF